MIRTQESRRRGQELITEGVVQGRENGDTFGDGNSAGPGCRKTRPAQELGHFLESGTLQLPPRRGNGTLSWPGRPALYSPYSSPHLGMREVLFVLLLLLVSIPGVRADATQRSRSSTPPLVVGGESLVVSLEDEMEQTGTGAGRPDGAGGPGATTVKVSDRDIISIEIGTWNIQSGRNG